MSNDVDQIVYKLLDAHRTKNPIDFIRNDYTLDEQTAYEVQKHFVQKKCELYDQEISGYKISMTSPKTQELASTNEPAYGTLTTNSLVKNSSTIDIVNLFDPLVEPELMFILTDDLSIGAAEDEILAKSKIAAGLEIPDSRYKDWFPNFSLADLLCDNGVTGRVVVSEPVNPPSFKDLEEIRMELNHNGEMIGEGKSDNVLGNPTSSVAWLTKKLAVRHISLKKGMVISSGTFISPLRLEKGTYKATYSTIGNVQVTIE
ncbi:2-keto-4-pentenoate hydratase [Virgibacillus sp. NKC19-16]|uniref:2-keto-4-pentenoate hydratase n=1 Tax=Virgibacillus salidurans TaxID=2831673 RepID=UPI001F19FE9E|nr:fumarylacetoacetate hydrolase family protein [Virgibacillus sp. NKC19-16]UJL47694.1 2-keto-4-pentenoate hydratase [Virgibacillus sp. NKC19-16]